MGRQGILLGSSDIFSVNLEQVSGNRVIMVSCFVFY